MSKQFMKRLGALCTGAVLTLGSFTLPGAANPQKASAADSDYAKLLQMSLYFYDANMCGNIEGLTALNWRGNCHTGDEVVGGYHDAGDHAMFGLPQGYSASTLGWSFYEFKDVYEDLGLSAHYQKISKHFADFFKASTKLSGDTVTNFLYQKGDGDVDHAYWGAPEKQERNQGVRKMFWSSNGASDIAAEYAASLALEYLNFGDEEALKYAKALYKFSTQYNQVATEGLQGKDGWFYKNGSCQDEQAWAAGWLYLATKEQSYLNDCKSKQTQYLGWVHGWETVATGAACVLAEITGDWSKVSGWFNSQTTGSGYWMLNGGDWGSARINCSMQMTCLIAQKHNAGNYLNWCKGQMDYILGNKAYPNGQTNCIVVGYKSNSSRNPHHRAASGYQGYDGSNGGLGNNKTYGPNGHLLIGALCGGPADSNGTYSDVIDDYKTNEVTLDYNAGLVGAAAGFYKFTKSGSVVTSLEGVNNVEFGKATSGGQQPDTPDVTTTAPKQNTEAKTYKLDVNQSYNYYDLKNKDATMIGFKYEDFGLVVDSPEKITKVEVNISANGNIGTYQGAFGTSTKVAPSYWAQDEDQGAVFQSNKGTIVWDTPSSIAEIIQYGYGGELKVGFWWIDNADFRIDSIVITTDGAGSTVPQSETTTTTTVTEPPEVTTTEPKHQNDTKPGDVDCSGSVNVADAILLAQYLAEISGTYVSPQGLLNAEVNGVAGLNSDDLTYLLEEIAGLH